MYFVQVVKVGEMDISRCQQTSHLVVTSRGREDKPRFDLSFCIILEQGSMIKPKRIRTTFSEDQLQILNANFNVDPNPDGHDLERIAKQTGLSKRVTQVWFQNSRARQKKQSSNSGMNYCLYYY